MITYRRVKDGFTVKRSQPSRAMDKSKRWARVQDETHVQPSATIGAAGTESRPETPSGAPSEADTGTDEPTPMDQDSGSKREGKKTDGRH